MEFAVGLVHHPVLDRAGNTVATNITNFDIHDIARACQVYGVENYFIIHPADEQLMFVSRVLDHWRTGPGARFNPMRRTALNPVKTAKSVEEAITMWGKKDAAVIATSAKEQEGIERHTFRGLRPQLSERPHMMLLGTGFGLGPEALKQCDGYLEPICGVGPKDYRHLSVRSALSICLDRLLGSW